MTLHRTITVGAALLAGATAAGAQGPLAARIAAARDGELQFEYAGREGICGNGRTFIRTSEHSYNGSWDDAQDDACVPGPVRVVLRKAGGEIVSLREYVGAVPTVAGRTELGEVPPADAAAFLLGLAETSQRGNVAREAIFPAMIARDVVAWPSLLRIARTRDAGRKNDVAFWLGRYAAAKLQGSDDPFVVERRADSDEEDVKKHAVFALSQLHGREGIDALLDVARTNRDPVVRANALFWLGQSGDPRALDLFDDILHGKVQAPRG